ncbi:hypothetical protein ACVWWG_005243 [Bradyrhizobium sp. LB7.2]
MFGPATDPSWNDDWFWSASVTISLPVADSVAPAESSVTVWTTGSPMTAASLAPLIVKETTLVVPSTDLMAKVSTLVSPSPRYWTALFATE